MDIIQKYYKLCDATDWVDKFQQTAPMQKVPKKPPKVKTVPRVEKKQAGGELIVIF